MSLVVRFLSPCLVLGGVLLLGADAWIEGKAWLAARLVERAFAAHLRDGAVHRPWSWADTWPVARLELPRLGVERIVLAGATGATLAFGPGHVDGTARPGDAGNSVIAGHRNTWFDRLGELRRGDTIRVDTHGGSRVYRVVRLEVVSMWASQWLEPTSDARLTLITCYPLDGDSPSVQRYLVVARAVDELEPRGRSRPRSAG